MYPDPIVSNLSIFYYMGNPRGKGGGGGGYDMQIYQM